MMNRTSFTSLLALVMVAGTAMMLPVAPAIAADEPTKAPQAPEPTLKVGDKAPALQVEKWLQGDEIKEFKSGHAYVVEFWATWCGPCVRAMPHMSELSQQYKDANIHFVGVNVWERPYNEETLGKVSAFVKEQGSRLTYNVAYDGKNAKMADAYMKAANRNGIPCAFVVDREGTVVWIGHPMALELPLTYIAKEKDPAKAAAIIKRAETLKASISENAKQKDYAAALTALETYAAEYPAFATGLESTKLGLLLEVGKEAEAYKLMSTMGDTAIAEKDAMTLNMLAWTIVDPEAPRKDRDLALAGRLAEKANEFSEGKRADVLDTLARVHFSKGQIEKAVEVQTKAVSAATGPMKADLEKTLEEYKAAMKS